MSFVRDEVLIRAHYIGEHQKLTFGCDLCSPSYDNVWEPRYKESLSDMAEKELRPLLEGNDARLEAIYERVLELIEELE